MLCSHAGSSGKQEKEGFSTRITQVRKSKASLITKLERETTRVLELVLKHLDEVQNQTGNEPSSIANSW